MQSGVCLDSCFVIFKKESQVSLPLLKRLTGSLAILPLLACSSASPPQASDPLVAYSGYTGQYPGFTLQLDERFDTFNTEIWRKGDGAVGNESACRFLDQGVQVKKGILTLLIQEEEIAAGWSDDHQKMKKPYSYSCGELRTLESTYGHGRIELRMKAPAREIASGYILSLFTYTNGFENTDLPIKEREWEEIDIELEGGRPDKFQANLIYGVNTWEWHRTREYGAWEDKIVVGPVDEWRVFALEWVPDRISWYVDGEHFKTLSQDDIDCQPECVGPQVYPAPIPDNLAYIMMNFWIPNDFIQDNFGGNKQSNRYPMRAEYDWIRYYRYDGE